MKLIRNTTAVLVLTLFTGLAVFTAIQLGGRLFGTPTASAQTVTTQAVTGESGGGSGNGHGQSSSGSTQGLTPTATTTRAAPAARAAARPTPVRPPAAPPRVVTPPSELSPAQA